MTYDHSSRPTDQGHSDLVLSLIHTHDLFAVDVDSLFSPKKKWMVNSKNRKNL